VSVHTALAWLNRWPKAKELRRHVEFDHYWKGADVANTMLACDEMRARGYARIGFVTGHAAQRGALYKAGFHMAQEWVEAPLRLPSLTIDDTDAAASCKRLSQWLRQTRPHAILTDISALRAMLKRIGCRVPDDVGLAALSILDGEASAGIDQRPEEIGRVAILLVSSLMNDQALGVPSVFRQILIEGCWTDGNTLPVR
jgi:DNA-binding LacI/PurR family transcriptional regulator